MDCGNLYYNFFLPPIPLSFCSSSQLVEVLFWSFCLACDLCFVLKGAGDMIQVSLHCIGLFFFFSPCLLLVICFEAFRASSIFPSISYSSTDRSEGWTGWAGAVMLLFLKLSFGCCTHSCTATSHSLYLCIYRSCTIGSLHSSAYTIRPLYSGVYSYTLYKSAGNPERNNPLRIPPSPPHQLIAILISESLFCRLLNKASSERLWKRGQNKYSLARIALHIVLEDSNICLVCATAPWQAKKASWSSSGRTWPRC